MIEHMHWSSAAPSRRSTALPIWPLALLMLWASGAAMAAPGRAPGLFVGASAGTQRFSQDDHAPPICCGERDRWHGWGPAVRAAAGWQFESGLSVSGDLGFASIAATGDAGEYDLQLYGYTLGVDFNGGLGPLSAIVGVGLAGAQYSGAFGPHEASGHLLGAQVRGGLHHPVSPRLSVGVDARLTAYAFTNTATDLTLGLTWAGL